MTPQRLWIFYTGFWNKKARKSFEFFVISHEFRTWFGIDLTFFFLQYFFNFSATLTVFSEKSRNSKIVLSLSNFSCSLEALGVRYFEVRAFCTTYFSTTPRVCLYSKNLRFSLQLIGRNDAYGYLFVWRKKKCLQASTL